jgi:hypothetical protein
MKTKIIRIIRVIRCKFSKEKKMMTNKRFFKWFTCLLILMMALVACTTGDATEYATETPADT